MSLEKISCQKYFKVMASRELPLAKPLVAVLCSLQYMFIFPCRKNKHGAERDRTADLMLAKHALSQLSYCPDY